MRIKSQTIRIPHLINYRLRIRVTSKLPVGTQAVCYRDSRFASTINVRPGATPFILAHEIMHVLRHICDDYQMNFIKESEHMAYLMQYLLGTAFGYEWGE